MDVNTGTDLAALHLAITATLAAAFPGVHFEFYREDRKNLPLSDGIAPNPPKAYGLLQLAEMDAAEADSGTGQQGVQELLLALSDRGGHADAGDQQVVGFLVAHIHEDLRCFFHPSAASVPCS